MALNIRLFPCLSDNYGLLIRDEATGEVATIDTPDADRILAELAETGWGRLDRILNTHWHADHTGGNARLQAETGCRILGPEEVARVAPLDTVVRGGDVVRLGQTELEVTATPGHTLGHVVYRSVADGEAFVGDTLFALGCGRLFEGTPQQMWDSLQTLGAWPDDTRVWCAHEYTAANARFALSVDHRPEMATYAQAVFAMREQERPTVPTTIGAEKAYNPFLTAGDVAEFAARRAAKDAF